MNVYLMRIDLRKPFRLAEIYHDCLVRQASHVVPVVNPEALTLFNVERRFGVPTYVARLGIANVQIGACA